MNSTTYLDDLILEGSTAEVSYRNLHTSAYINKSNGDIIKIPYMSLTNKYKDYLSVAVEEVEFTPEQYRTYRFNPKGLSLFLYGTTEYWYALLELNNKVSVIEFDLETLKVYDPKKLKPIINEIFILEGLLV